MANPGRPQSHPAALDRRLQMVDTNKARESRSYPNIELTFSRTAWLRFGFR